MQSMPDMSELMKLAASPAGRKLLSILSNSNLDLDKLAADASSGNLESAKKQISDILNSDDAQNLLKQMRDSL